MKRLNVFVSEEAHEAIQRYQKEHGLSTRDEATDKYILEAEKARQEAEVARLKSCTA